jgi:hypothetical protein
MRSAGWFSALAGDGSLRSPLAAILYSATVGNPVAPSHGARIRTSFFVGRQDHRLASDESASTTAFGPL